MPLETVYISFERTTFSLLIFICFYIQEVFTVQKLVILLFTQSLLQNHANRLRSIGIRAQVCHPNYQTLYRRVRSFQRWPHLRNIKDTNRMAETGLFYIGISA